MKSNAEDDPVVPGGTYRMLMSIALLGTELGAFAAATDIATVLKELRPDLPHASTVLGVSAFSQGKFESGLRLLEEAVQAFPDFQMGKAMVAVCMDQLNKPGWRDILESVIDDGRDENAVGLACVLLQRHPPNAASEEIMPVGLPANAMWA